MEMVLDVYMRPYDPCYPVVCMDESPKQLIAERRAPIAACPGQPARCDYEYRRCGVCNIFLACEPLAGKRLVAVREKKTKHDWAHFVDEIALLYKDAVKITLVMDNLNTHSPGALYEAFPPERAKALWDRFDFVYTPKHGSWLNMAEIEIGLLARTCLDRRIGSREFFDTEVRAYLEWKNRNPKPIQWQFTNEQARLKLKSLYPSV